MFDYDSAREHMIDCQIRTSDVTDPRILQAFRRVRRERFVPKSQQALAYGDGHIMTDLGRVMIKPRDLAKMVLAADIGPGDLVLDVACGRGYSTAILAQLAETVIGLETLENCVARATANLEAEDISNAVIIEGDLKNGAKGHGPFDVIFVNGSVAKIPHEWIDQLSDKGRLIVTRNEGQIGRSCVLTKSGDVVGEKIVFDSFLPLIDGFADEPAFVF